MLDEPSIGLHAADTARLIRVLERLRDQGNTVVVVEHDLEVMKAADWLVELGPGAGRRGGELMVEGTAKDVIAHAGLRDRQISLGRIQRRTQSFAASGAQAFFEPHGLQRA